MAYYCRFSLGENLDFLQKSFITSTGDTRSSGYGIVDRVEASETADPSSNPVIGNIA